MNLPQRPLLGLIAAAALAGGAAGCASRAQSSAVTGGQNSRTQADRYTAKAVRRSPEGFILIPSRKAERAFDQVRLNEIAQALRGPAAICFINRAIETIAREEKGGEIAYTGVPEGQAKIRVRIAPSGEVLRAEVLDTGFTDEAIETCLTALLEQTKWPANRSGNIQWIDVIYWVSLGSQAEDTSPTAAKELRRQQGLAAVRGKGCFTGRVAPGKYHVEGLSLLDRDGITLVNRIEPNELPGPVSQCLAVAFREVRMPRAADTFVRPFLSSIDFEVLPGGDVTFTDERWLTLITLEEEAEREARRAALTGGESSQPPGAGVDLGPEDPAAEVIVDGARGVARPPGGAARAGDKAPADAAADPQAPSDGTGDPPAVKPPTKGPSKPAADPPADPGKGGLRLNLGGRPG